jgi:hypothetical protein
LLSRDQKRSATHNQVLTFDPTVERNFTKKKYSEPEFKVGYSGIDKWIFGAKEGVPEYESLVPLHLGSFYF